MFFVVKKCRIYAALGVSQTPNQILYWEANAGSFVKGEMEDAAKRNKADGELEICAGKAR